MSAKWFSLNHQVQARSILLFFASNLNRKEKTIELKHFNSYSTACVNADEKCWKMKDIRSRKDGFIRCPKSMIFIKEVKFEVNIDFYWQKCPVFYCPDVKELLKCNGLFGLCGMNDVDILTILEKYANSCDVCYWNRRVTRVCIVFDCIHGMCKN